MSHCLGEGKATIRCATTMKNHLQFGLSICENYKKYACVEYFGEIICNPTVAHAAIATMWQRRNRRSQRR